MFSTVTTVTATGTGEKSYLVHTACGVESSMNSAAIDSCPQSTGPTTTATLLNL
jgi:hypothetical protein